MTDFDKKLIDKARRISRWDYRYIDALASIADSAEARERLRHIGAELYWDAEESL